MARVIYAPQALRALERIVDFIAEKDGDLAARTLAMIEEAVSILERHPEIGHVVENGLRELVVSRGSTGYVGLYRFYPQHDRALVLALRHQREAGYR